LVLRVYGAFFAFGLVAAAFNHAASRARMRPGLVTAVNVALAFLAAPCMLLVSEPREWFSDFRKAYYAAGHKVLTGPPAMYGQGELLFVNLPVLALPFAPLASLPLRPAKYVFTLVGVGAVATAWWLLVRLSRADARRGAALMTLFVLHGPLYYSIREGNLTHFLLPLLAGGLWCLERRRDFWVGVLVAVAGLIKLPVLLLGVYFLWKRRWRAVAGGAAVLALAAGSSLALFGPGLHRVWYDRCIGPYAAQPMSDYNVQSAGAVLVRLLTPGPLDGYWRPVVAGPASRSLNLLMAAGLAGMVWLAARRPAGPERSAAERLEFCAVLCLALLISPVSWTHYYLLLLIPFGLYLAGGLPLPTGRSAVMLGLSLALVSPPVVAWSASTKTARLLASHYFMGGALLLGVLSAARWAGSQAPAGSALLMGPSTRPTRAA
jgi:hypothetical protein